MNENIDTIGRKCPFYSPAVKWCTAVDESGKIGGSCIFREECFAILQAEINKEEGR